MTNKEKYIDHCKKEDSIPIFSQPWWLDIVCGKDNWDVVLVEKSLEVVASLPFYFGSKYGFSSIKMPVLTQKLGPWIKYPPGQKYDRKLSTERELLDKLISQLPAFDRIEFNCDYTLKNWLPFYWAGYQQTTRYTYIIENLKSFDDFLLSFRGKIRTEIKKAEKKVRVEIGQDIEEFYRVNAMTFQRQKMEIPYSLDTVGGLHQELKNRDRCQIYLARDELGRVHAAIFVIWDKQSAYYIMGGGDPDLRSSGATSLLFFEAIKDMQHLVDRFDFEGSMIKSIERYFSGFGTIQVPYFQLSRFNSKILRIRDLLRI